MPEARTRSLTMAEAANHALRRALTERPEVMVYGEDVAIPGGVFGVTKGLRKDFGDRVFDTPISESAILGSAVGAAVMGARPIVEIMWSDFMLVAFDQIVNQAANVRYLSRGSRSAALTIRTQQGMSPGACAQHSQSLESLLLHIPGLRVAMPATAQAAHDVLLASVWCDDPTIVIENRTLYFREKEEVVLGEPVQVAAGAVVDREGSDLTLVTWGAMLHVAREAATQLELDGISVEIIDARWLAPFDYDTLEASLGRTSRLAVLHEATRTGGFAAEIITTALERRFPMSHVPLRLTTPDVRVPAAQTLMTSLRPSAASVSTAIRRYVEQTR